jgi:hypothetical protein
VVYESVVVCLHWWDGDPAADIKTRCQGVGDLKEVLLYSSRRLRRRVNRKNKSLNNPTVHASPQYLKFREGLEVVRWIKEEGIQRAGTGDDRFNGV